jgi:putative PIN family toxin of toxin-antitoxin system
VRSAVRVVLDTNIVVSALVWGGRPYELIAAATEERLELYSSPALLGELADVLSRAKFAPRLEQAQRTVAQLIEQYRGLVEVVSVEPIAPAVSADPDDDQVLAAALAAQADLIVSGDADLQRLGCYEGIQIVSAAQCLQCLSSE